MLLLPTWAFIQIVRYWCSNWVIILHIQEQVRHRVLEFCKSEMLFVIANESILAKTEYFPPLMNVMILSKH